MNAEEPRPLRHGVDPEFAEVYALVDRWKAGSLLTDESLIDPAIAAWRPDVANELYRRIALEPDQSKDSFTGKLVKQLAGASQEVHVLLADLLVVHMLATENIGLTKKLELIDAVGALAPEPFVVPDSMHGALKRGPVNAGTGFLTNRFWIVSWMISFATKWTALADSERSSLLVDPWAMKEFVADVPGERAQSQRNALLFLLFPETFEDITSDAHKRRILEGHADVAGDDPDLDRRLLTARTALEERFGPDFSWYSVEVRPTWDHSATSNRVNVPEPDDPVELLSDLFDDEADLYRFAEAAAEAIRVAHEVNPAGWALNRRSGGAALTVGANKVLEISRARSVIVGRGQREHFSEMPVFADSEINQYRRPEDAVWIVSPHTRIGETLDAVGDGFLSAVRDSATSKSAVRRFFAEDLLIAIEQLADTQLPRPDLAGAGEAEQAWVIRMKRDGARVVVDAIRRGDVRIFWPIDVPAGSSLAEVKKALSEADPEIGPHRLGNHAGQIHRFITKMAVGDFVLAPDGDDLYVGQVASEPRFEDDEWVRDMTWANADSPIERSDITPALYSRLRTLLTVTEISDLAGELALLAEVADTSADAPEVVSAPRPREVQFRPIDAETARSLHLDTEWLQEIVDLLERKRQLIFYGPPGTGKTYVAEKLAQHLVDEPSNYRVVQFHPSYSYEDFVEGFRPVVDADGGMVYELKPGPLKQLADEARANPGDAYVLIVDEINRGNLAKIFGELYYLLEYRENSIVLQYGTGVDDEFSLPTNLFLIGTMNTADRSIALVDAAIRRRFGFVEFSPLEQPVDSMLRTWLKRQGRDDLPARLLDELNQRLGDRDLAIGPSYLMKPESADADGLARIWRYEIMPLLDEQLYGRPEMAARLSLESLLRSIDPPVADEISAEPSVEEGAGGGAASTDDD